MAYIIVSPRLGTPGDPYEPAEGTNVDALVEAGFVSVQKPSKKTKVETNEQE